MPAVFAAPHRKEEHAMKKMWRKTVLPGVLLLFALLLMPETAQAKSKGVALTEKNFPDVGLLAEVKKYDKDKNGYLSKKELAAVTDFDYDLVIHDFSQLKYFTNIKRLYLSGFDWGLWLGGEVDLTMFPKLEEASIWLDTESHWADASEVQIKVTGLKHLKTFRVYDEAAAGLHINEVDFRNTPALREVAVSGAKGVVFDDGAKLEKLWLYGVPEIPVEQIENFAELTQLSISTKDPEFTTIDLSGLSRLTGLQVKGDFFEALDTAGADALKKLEIEGGTAKKYVLSGSRTLKNVTLRCPLLEELYAADCPALKTLHVYADGLTVLDVGGDTSLTSLHVESNRLETIDVHVNPALEKMEICSDVLKALDIRANTALEWLTVRSDALELIDTGKNKALDYLELTGDHLASVDVSKNPALKSLVLETKRLEEVDISKNKRLSGLRIDSQELTQLRLGDNQKLHTLSVTAPKLTELDLSANTELWGLKVNNTSLEELKLPGLERLDTLTLEGNEKLETLDVSGSPELCSLTLEGDGLTSLNLLRQTELRELSVVRCRKLTELKMASNVDLRWVVIKDTAVRSLIFPKQHRLQSLSVMENPMLTELDLSRLPKLVWAVITGNEKLPELDFSNNHILYEAYIDNNPLRTVTFGEVPNMKNLFCQNTALTEIDLSGATRADLVVYCDEGVKITGYTGTVHTEKPELDADRYPWAVTP